MGSGVCVGSADGVVVGWMADEGAASLISGCAAGVAQVMVPVQVILRSHRRRYPQEIAAYKWCTSPRMTRRGRWCVA